MNSSQQLVLNYYKSLESKFGYKHLLGETKHFGYYPKGVNNISEEKAQELMSDLVIEKLGAKSNELLLDVGCGYGVTSCYLAKKYKVSVIGIDINAYEINKAKQRALKMNIEKQASFKKMDYSYLLFAKNHFDALFTLETLSHAPNLPKTLKGLLKILKPGGKATFFEYTLAKEKYFTPRELKMLRVGIEGTAALGLKEFKHDQFPNYLRKIGFKKIKEQNITANMLPSLRKLKDLAVIPYFFIKLFGLQRHFVNATVAVEWYDLMKKDLIRYCIFTAQK